MSCPFGPDHPTFVVTALPGGVVDLSVCWDSTNVREVAAMIREVADGLDALPEDYSAAGVKPLSPRG